MTFTPPASTLNLTQNNLLPSTVCQRKLNFTQYNLLLSKVESPVRTLNFSHNLLPSPLETLAKTLNSSPVETPPMTLNFNKDNLLPSLSPVETPARTLNPSPMETPPMTLNFNKDNLLPFPSLVETPAMTLNPAATEEPRKETLLISQPNDLACSFVAQPPVTYNFCLVSDDKLNLVLGRFQDTLPPLASRPNDPAGPSCVAPQKLNLVQGRFQDTLPSLASRPNGPAGPFDVASQFHEGGDRGGGAMGDLLGGWAPHLTPDLPLWKTS